MPQNDRVAAIITLLEQEYCSPRHGNSLDPLDELIYIKLSQQTNAVKFTKVFDALHARGWDWVAGALEDQVAEELRYLGLHAMLNQILIDWGELDLTWLSSQPTDGAITYLCSLPGVGIKTAYCVAMHALDAPVLPVDTHVGRVAARLGLVPEAKEYKGLTVHRALEEAIPSAKRYSFHINAVAHGRAQRCHRESKQARSRRLDI